jgi:hypothetical protein
MSVKPLSLASSPSTGKPKDRISHSPANDPLMNDNEKDCIRSALVKDGRVLAESSASISDTIR